MHDNCNNLKITIYERGLHLYISVKYSLTLNIIMKRGIEMLDEINQMRKLLEKNLQTRGLKDRTVLEISKKLDRLILKYYNNQCDDQNNVLDDDKIGSSDKEK